MRLLEFESDEFINYPCLPFSRRNRRMGIGLCNFGPGCDERRRVVEAFSKKQRRIGEKNKLE